MRIIIVCGDPECGEEYPADTTDRTWECPHCGRVRENMYYPFLNARLMNARIHSDEADWRELHDELLSKARRRVEELKEHASVLRKDLSRLRMQLPEEKREAAAGSDHPMPGTELVDGWDGEAPEGDMTMWRELYDQLLEGARGEIVALEDAIHAMEDELRSVKAELGFA